MTFVKGSSGNPNGRPPNSRALTALLEAAGNTTVDVDGKKLARKRIVAAGLWEGVTEGTITLPGGKVLQLEPGDYLALAKWLYSHIDGPPKAEIDVTSNGETLKIYAGFDPEAV